MTDPKYEVLSSALLLTTLILKWLRDEFRAKRNNQKIEEKVDVATTKVDEARDVAVATKEAIERKVDENTDISKQAFTAANDFNAKLLKISDRQVELGNRVLQLEKKRKPK